MLQGRRTARRWLRTSCSILSSAGQLGFQRRPKSDRVVDKAAIGGHAGAISEPSVLPEKTLLISGIKTYRELIYSVDCLSRSLDISKNLALLSQPTRVEIECHFHRVILGKFGLQVYN